MSRWWERTVEQECLSFSQFMGRTEEAWLWEGEKLT